MFLHRILWAVLFVCVVIYGMTGYFSVGSNVPPPATNLSADKIHVLIVGFAVFSAVLGVASLWVRKKFCCVDIIQKKLSGGPLDESGEGIKDAQAQGGTPLEVAAAQILLPGYVISWALSEAVAIHGWTLSQMLKNPHFYWWFGVPSIVLFVVNRPRIALVKEGIERFKNGG